MAMDLSLSSTSLATQGPVIDVSHISVHRNRTNVHLVSLGMNVAGQTFRSEIREGQSPESDLIATWIIDIVGDGSSGQLRLSLDDSITKEITHNVGYMDILREQGGEPYSMLEAPLLVFFYDMPTEPSESPLT